MTLDRSPKFSFKRLIYRFILETGHAPDDLPCCLTCFKFDAELFNLHISLSCILKNPTKIFSFLPQIRHFDIQVYFLKCTYYYYLYKWTLPYLENEVHIVIISNGNNIYHVQ